MTSVPPLSASSTSAAAAAAADIESKAMSPAHSQASSGGPVAGAHRIRMPSLCEDDDINSVSFGVGRFSVAVPNHQQQPSPKKTMADAVRQQHPPPAASTGAAQAFVQKQQEQEGVREKGVSKTSERPECRSPKSSDRQNESGNELSFTFGNEEQKKASRMSVEPSIAAAAQRTGGIYELARSEMARSSNLEISPVQPSWHQQQQALPEERVSVPYGHDQQLALHPYGGSEVADPTIAASWQLQQKQEAQMMAASAMIQEQQRQSAMMAAAVAYGAGAAPQPTPFGYVTQQGYLQLPGTVEDSQVHMSPGGTTAYIVRNSHSNEREPDTLDAIPALEPSNGGSLPIWRRIIRWAFIALVVAVLAGSIVMLLNALHSSDSTTENRRLNEATYIGERQDQKLIVRNILLE